jgi:hypothetical protein
MSTRSFLDHFSFLCFSFLASCHMYVFSVRYHAMQRFPPFSCADMNGRNYCPFECSERHVKVFHLLHIHMWTSNYGLYCMYIETPFLFSFWCPFYPQLMSLWWCVCSASAPDYCIRSNGFPVQSLFSTCCIFITAYLILLSLSMHSMSLIADVHIYMYMFTLGMFSEYILVLVNSLLQYPYC